MKAIVREKAGKEFSGLRVKEISPQDLEKNQVRIKVRASRINPADMDLMKGMPFLKYKDPQIAGIDGSGTITEISESVNHFQVGDNVFFYRPFSDIGTWGQEISIDSRYIARIPSNLSLEQSGSIVLPLLTAFDSLIQLDHKPGEKLLIHGVGGGVGFIALQLARKLGLSVIGTASSSDQEKLEKAGIDRIIDYKKEKFEDAIGKNEVHYILDLVGGNALLKSITLKPKKIISVHYLEPEKMSRVGVQFPGILKWIMKFLMKKFDKIAIPNGVQLIGQVTGPDGNILQKASDLLATINYIDPKSQFINLSEIESRGLNRNDLGKTILFS